MHVQISSACVNIHSSNYVCLPWAKEVYADCMVLLKSDLMCMYIILWVCVILSVCDMTVCILWVCLILWMCVCVCDIMSVCVILWVYVWYSYEHCLKQVFPLVKKRSSEKFYFNYFLLIPRNTVDWFLFLFMYLATQHGMWDLNSQTRDRTWVSCSGSSES